MTETAKDEKKGEKKDESKKKGSYIKILNKKKDSVLIYHPSFGKKEAKWDEFNDLYQIDKEDPHKAYLKPEHEEKFSKAIDILNEMCAMMLMSNSIDPVVAFNAKVSIGSRLSQLCKITGLSMSDANQLFRDYYNRQVNGMLEMGIGFGKPHHKMMSKRQIAKSNQNIRKLNRENKESASEENESEDTHLEHGCSIGDMIKAKGQKL